MAPRHAAKASRGAAVAGSSTRSSVRRMNAYRASMPRRWARQEEKAGGKVRLRAAAQAAASRVAGLNLSRRKGHRGLSSNVPRCSRHQQDASKRSFSHLETVGRAVHTS